MNVTNTPKQLHAFYGLKWNPFLADIPASELIKNETIKSFCYRMENIVIDGGFALITGQPGTGKSVMLRQVQEHLLNIPELNVKVLTRPQSKIRDFYRELLELFDIPFNQHNRFNGFAKLRESWKQHIKNKLLRPVLLIDEAQEVDADVLNELRILSSLDLDSKNILAVVLAGDARLTEKLRQSNLLPLESRIRVKQHLDKRTPSELAEILSQSLEKAGSADLMTKGLIQAVSEHAAGNLRSMMLMCDELLSLGNEKKERQLTENLFYEAFKSQANKKRVQK
jgi:general secretion pathway protein A